jgi:cytochrome c oxidase cbb3-type subunit III
MRNCRWMKGNNMTEHDKKEIDHLSGIETTGHEWDGLKELNNPAPRWWLWVFYATVIWSIGYWVLYPAWPTISGATKGTLNTNQYQALATSQGEIVARQDKWLAQFKTANYDQILQDDGLSSFARAGGSAAFKDNCATCHGTGAAGGKGYPNLNDDDWLWGGTIEDIEQTIRYGIRSGHDEARDSAMPAFGKDALLKSEEIGQAADYVVALAAHKEKADMPGAAVYATNCASCHGDNGQGGRDFGAPRLNDAIWLYGGTRADIYAQVQNPRHGVMPYWQGRLNDQTIRQLAVYVYSLGGGEKTAPAVVTPEPTSAPAPEVAPDVEPEPTPAP